MTHEQRWTAGIVCASHEVEFRVGMAVKSQGARGRAGAPMRRSTRRVLLEAATSLFEERGYHATSVESIVVRRRRHQGRVLPPLRWQAGRPPADPGGLHRQPPATASRSWSRSPTPRSGCVADLRGAGRHREVPRPGLHLQRGATVPDRSRLRPDQGQARQGQRLLRVGDPAGHRRGRLLAGPEPRIVSFSILGMAAWALSWFRPGGQLSIRDVADQMSMLVLSGALVHRTDRAGGRPRR